MSGAAPPTSSPPSPWAYLLTTDTSLQKIFLLCGPRRSGKGTIARILRRLLGEANVCGPTLSSLGNNFGLQPLLGRLAAIVSDARLGKHSDTAAIAERLLSISGEDAITIPRKYQPDVTVKLPTRFMLLSNELPRLDDSSGALAGRFVVLTLRHSFYGQENPRLTEELTEELPGILLRAIGGLHRLQQRGGFELPDASREAIEQLEDLTSPIGAFVRECCEVEPGARVECSVLYGAWRDWCSDQGWEHHPDGGDVRTRPPGGCPWCGAIADTDARNSAVGVRRDTAEMTGCHQQSLVPTHCTRDARESVLCIDNNAVSLVTSGDSGATGRSCSDE